MIGGGPCRVGGGGVSGGGGVGGGGVIGGGGGVGGGGVIGGSCGGMVCGGSGCGEGADVITWVGTGQGSYIQETTYKYVGMGAGEFETVQVGGNNWCICIGGGFGLLLLVGLLVWLLLPAPPTTTTTVPPTSVPAPTTPAPAPSRPCIIFGDPHMMTFDGEHSDYYTPGEFYLVKSDTVNIQGRFQPLPITNGLGVTTEIAVSGSFLKNKVLIIGTKDALFDDMPIPLTFPGQWADPEGLVKITYDSVGDNLQQGREGKQKKVLHVALGGLVNLQINRYDEPGEGAYINAKITMPPQPNQDGDCGNMNQNPADDDRLQVRARMGENGVPAAELLFKGGKTAIRRDPNKVDISDCPSEKLHTATEYCKGQASNGMATMECLFAQCFP